METEFKLPAKVMPALRRLLIDYKNKEESLLCKIIETGWIYVDAGTQNDEWGNVYYSHCVYFFLPEKITSMIDLNLETRISRRIAQDINSVTRDVSDESIGEVFLKLEDQTDTKFQEAIPFSDKDPIRPEDTGLWKDNYLRLFLSHRDKYKNIANELANRLKFFGICAFVAHDSIEALNQWPREIEKALKTMDAMLVFLTDDFHESVWTNQEVGFAQCRNVPIIPAKIEKSDPKGFIWDIQGLPASVENSVVLFETAFQISYTLFKVVKPTEQVKSTLIDLFLGSFSYKQSERIAKLLKNSVKNLTDFDLDRIKNGFARNVSLHKCWALEEPWFKEYLESATGKKIIVQDKMITVASTD